VITIIFTLALDSCFNLKCPLLTPGEKLALGRLEVDTLESAARNKLLYFLANSLQFFGGRGSSSLHLRAFHPH